MELQGEVVKAEGVLRAHKDLEERLAQAEEDYRTMNHELVEYKSAFETLQEVLPCCSTLQLSWQNPEHQLDNPKCEPASQACTLQQGEAGRPCINGFAAFKSLWPRGLQHQSRPGRSSCCLMWLSRLCRTLTG